MRYVFGITPEDGRLNKPEFLGGGSTRVQISEVLQTGPETSVGGGTDFGVGDMYGHGLANMRGNAYRRHFTEHGYIHTMFSVRPRSVYTSGIPRHFLRQDREDFFQKEFQHIGQQEVKVNEIYADSTNGDNVFGYQDRYREYREQPSQVAGEFRTSLNYWHMGREFASEPTLNASFVECDATDRIFNVSHSQADSLWVMLNHRCVARRHVEPGGRNKII